MGAVCSSSRAASNVQDPEFVPPAEPTSGKPAHKTMSLKPTPAQTAHMAVVAEEEEEEEVDGEDQGPKPALDLPARRKALNKCFDQLDKDESGFIEQKELRMYLYRTGVALPDLMSSADALMAKLDVNKDEKVSREEFVEMMEALTINRSDDEMHAWIAEIMYAATAKNVAFMGTILADTLAALNLTAPEQAMLQECFNAFVAPGHQGAIQAQDLKAVLIVSQEGQAPHGEAVEAKVQDIREKLDVNRDGKVSEQEFYVVFADIKKAMSQSASSTAFQDLLTAVHAACKQGRQAEALQTLAQVERPAGHGPGHGTEGALETPTSLPVGAAQALHESPRPASDRPNALPPIRPHNTTSSPRPVEAAA